MPGRGQETEAQAKVWPSQESELACRVRKHRFLNKSHPQFHLTEHLFTPVFLSSALKQQPLIILITSFFLSTV